MGEEKVNWYFISCMLLGIVSMIGIMLVGSGTYLSIIGLVAGFIGLREVKKMRWLGWLGIAFNAVGLGSLLI